MNEISFFLFDINYYYAATFIFIISAIIYGIDFFFQKKLHRIARMTSIAGVLLMSVGMTLRWINYSKPIVTSLFEMMLWFAWGAVIIMLISEFKFKYQYLGFFVLPFVVILMGILLLLPGRDAGVQMPALQSFWLYLHVAVAIISYAAFLVGFSAAIMYFIKKGINRHWFGLIASIWSLFTLIIIKQGDVLLSQNYIIRLKGDDQLNTISFREVGILLVLSFVLYLISTLLSIISLRKGSGKLADLKSPVLMISGMILLLSTLVLIIRLSIHENMSVLAQPVELSFLISALIINLLLILVNNKYEVFRGRIPSEELLDNLQYYTVSFGFPFLTLTIITGAIWANKAWGSYWGNDPKEWAAAVTWLVYAAYLHMRITKGWSGIKAAAILIIGFLAVMFTLIGITYLATGGMHSYG